MPDVSEFGNGASLSGFEPESDLPYYRARYYDPTIGRFLSEDLIRFNGGVNFYRYVDDDPVDSMDPYGLLQLCCRPARSVTWLGIKGCHCFLKLSDGTTLGGYWKPFSDTTYGTLEKRRDYKDDRNPPDQPDCKDLPGSECEVRKAFDELPKRTAYIPFYATSNAVPAATLTLAGIPFRMPSCAFGALPYNLGALGSHAPVPINSVPKVTF